MSLLKESKVIKVAPLLGVKSALQTLRHSPKHQLGQNFLLNTGPLHHYARQIPGSPEDTLLEIGPGLGHLTQILISSGCKMWAVEKDKILAAYLESVFPSGLEVDCSDIRDPWMIKKIHERKPRFIVGNLPYYLASSLVEDFLNAPFPIHSLAFMLPVEVGEKYTARPGDRNFGYQALSAGAVASVYCFHLFPAEDFYPKPRVDSGFYLFEFQKKPWSDLLKPFLGVPMRNFFSSPRKKISSRFPHQKREVETTLESLGYSKSARGHEIKPEDIVVLLQKFSDGLV